MILHHDVSKKRLDLQLPHFGIDLHILACEKEDSTSNLGPIASTPASYLAAGALWEHRLASFVGESEYKIEHR